MVAHEYHSEDKSRLTVLGVAIRWPYLARQVFIGFLLGFFLLHPVSVAIFCWLDPRIEAAMEGASVNSVWIPIVHSFSYRMLPMGVVFGVLGVVISTFYGFHRLMLTVRRDRLAEQLGRNERLRAELVEQADQLKQKNAELAALELANRRTTQFMAHDFKTALACITGFSSELLDRSELDQDPEVADALVRIRRQAHRLVGSVTDLLVFARTREGGTPQMEPVNVSSLLQDAVNDFSLPAHTEQITICEGHEACPPIWGDPRLLRRTICNLISNAIKHNGPETRVFVDAKVAEGQEVLFTCRDNGAGVEPELLPTIFTEFTTAGSAWCGSTGLGLAFCKAVAEAHGGRIWCENSDHGATFRFTIPLHTDKEQDNV